MNQYNDLLTRLEKSESYGVGGLCYEAAAAVSALRGEVERLTTERSSMKASGVRDGRFLDSMWACKVCDGEIPDGHTNDCDIWKLEKKHRDFLANEYNAVLTERDTLRAALADKQEPG